MTLFALKMKYEKTDHKPELLFNKKATYQSSQGLLVLSLWMYKYPMTNANTTQILPLPNSQYQLSTLKVHIKKIEKIEIHTSFGKTDCNNLLYLSNVLSSIPIFLFINLIVL